MEEIIKIETVTAYNKMRGLETLHPLVKVIDLSKAGLLFVQTKNYWLWYFWLDINGETKFTGIKEVLYFFLIEI